MTAFYLYGIPYFVSQDSSPILVHLNILSFICLIEMAQNVQYVFLVFFVWTYHPFILKAPTYILYIYTFHFQIIFKELLFFLSFHENKKRYVPIKGIKCIKSFIFHFIVHFVYQGVFVCVLMSNINGIEIWEGIV